MLPGSLKSRIYAYVEVVIVSLIWFLVAAICIVLLFTFFVRIAAPEWVQKGMEWPLVVTFIVVFLLPYLIVAARIWEVDLKILTAEAKRVVMGQVATKPERILEPFAPSQKK